MVRKEDTAVTCASTCGEECGLCTVTTVLTVLPLGLIAYYDWKIAATTLVVVVVMGALRRIFCMIIAEENACAVAVGE